MHPYPHGFTLIQILITIAILGILAAIAYPSYQSQVQAANLRAVQSALLQNAQFMEHYYRQNGAFKSSSTTWPDLPVGATDTFCIRHNNNAKGFHDNRFTIKAVALDTGREPRVLKIDESLTTFLCSSSSSSCSETEAFFNGNADKDCEIFQP